MATDVTKQSVRGSVLSEADHLVNGDRNNAYGPPTQDFRRTAGMASSFGFRFAAHEGAEPVALSAHHVAIFIALVKLSRLAWTPQKRDSWVDLAGYAACGAECAFEDPAPVQLKLFENPSDVGVDE
jgi:hypothetical protein